MKKGKENNSVLFVGNNKNDTKPNTSERSEWEFVSYIIQSISVKGFAYGFGLTEKVVPHSYYATSLTDAQQKSELMNVPICVEIMFTNNQTLIGNASNSVKKVQVFKTFEFNSLTELINQFGSSKQKYSGSVKADIVSIYRPDKLSEFDFKTVSREERLFIKSASTNNIISIIDTYRLKPDKLELIRKF